MIFLEKLVQAADRNNSLVCVGLDIDLAKVPQNIVSQEDPIFIFNKRIIDATRDFVCAYKPNSAFYEKYGIYGLQSLIKTIEYINTLNIPVILDAKRGDIGNSSAAYAEAAFKVFKADAITVSPYMGEDSLAPFIEYKDKGVFVLCLTSNPGAADFQRSLYKNVAQKVKSWNKHHNCGLVVGATKPEELAEIRQIVGELPILIPGVGAQQGDLQASVRAGVDKNGDRAIINSSRGIIYAADPGEEAKKLRDEINRYRHV